MIDTHSHIYLQEFASDISEVILRAKEAGIEKIIMPNINSQTIDKMLKLKDLYPDFLLAAMGLHPTEVNENYLEELLIIENQFNNENFVAVGEIGIDLYWDTTYEKEQIIVFQKQCQMALQHNLPIIIHVRNSFEKTMQALNPFKNSGLRGVFHSFGGSVEQANEIFNFGDFYLGINGIVTFKNSNLAEVLREVPLQRIVTETDAPYLAPVPNRGKRNEPAFISFVVKKLSEIYQISENQIDIITTQNAKNLFNL